MKKIFFLFAILASVAASATVTVTPISTDYAAQKVTFSVSWTNTPTAPYNNRVWVWIDFCPVNGVTPGSFAPATITGATITSGSGSTSTLTGRGFFIIGSATNSGATVTATLNPVPAGQFNWCVYGSDYPPNATAANGTYTLKGTPPFKLITTNGSTTQTVNEKTIATSAVTITPATITDATGYPGLWCPYTGSDLYMDATHLCQPRTSGAQNWEAYIKDSRDNKIYRITQFSDNSWWMAEDMNNATKVKYTCSGTNLYSPLDKPDCPNGWIMPTMAKITNRWPAPANDDVYGGTWTIAPFVHGGCGTQSVHCNQSTSTSGGIFAVASDCQLCLHWYYGDTAWHSHCYGYVGCTHTGEASGGRVRCYRQL